MILLSALGNFGAINDRFWHAAVCDLWGFDWSESARCGACLLLELGLAGVDVGAGCLIEQRLEHVEVVLGSEKLTDIVGLQIYSILALG